MFSNMFFSFKLGICQDPRIALHMRIPPKIQHFAHFSLVSLSPRTRSRPDAERIRQSEGGWSRPPKTALERSYLTENSSSENRILRPRRKKTPDRIAPPKMIYYIFDLPYSVDKLMHFLPQLSDFVPLRNGFYSFRAHVD